MSVAAACAMTACDDDDYAYPNPDVSGAYEIVDLAYGYTVSGNKGQVLENEFEVPGISIGDVWSFDNGTLTITKVDGTVEKCSYTTGADQRVAITFADGTQTEGFQGAYRGIDYFYPLDENGEEDTTQDPEYQQKWIGFGDAIYVTHNGTRYRLTIPGRRTLEKEPFDGVKKLRW